MNWRNNPRFMTEADPVNWLRFALCFVAEFAFTRGWRYTVDAEPVPMAIQLISPNNAVILWGVAWFVAAGAALVSILRAWPGGSLLTICLSLAFAFGFTVSWVQSWDGDPVQGAADYANAGTYWFVFGVLGAGYFLARGAQKWVDSLDIA